MDGIRLPNYVCFVCGEPIYDNEWHFCHEDDCPTQIHGMFACDCDLHAHPECCPICNPKERINDVNISRVGM